MPYPGTSVFPSGNLYPGAVGFTIVDGQLTLFTNVPGVPAAPPATGLIGSAIRPDLARWESGLAWIPERCATTYQLLPWCIAPVGTYTHPHPGAAYYRPVGLRFADECTTLNGPVDYARITRTAEAQTPFAIARELWTGATSLTDPYIIPKTGATATNDYLASPAATIVGTGGASMAVAFGRLEQAALEASQGMPVMIHVPVRVLPQITSLYLIREPGPTLITWAGNTVVADAGYPGTGPAGQAVAATAWMYATTPVAVLTSPLVVDENDAWQVNRDTNTRTVWANRVFAATFDPCVHLATEITI